MTPKAKTAAKKQPIRLRTLAAADFETVYELDQLCYSREVAYSRRELGWYMRLPGAEGVVAEVDDRVGGFILWARFDDTGHIITIDVLEEYRRLGVGTALLNEAERRIARRGAVQIELETAVNNTAAIAFWKRHGYQTRGILQNYYPGGLNAYAMMKPLEAGRAKKTPE
jgi:ribosomal protein S18 acetylase RimI-like enzyme